MQIDVDCPSCGKKFKVAPPKSPALQDTGPDAAEFIRLQNEATMARDERDRAIAERDRLVIERDSLKTQLDAAQAAAETCHTEESLGVAETAEELGEMSPIETPTDDAGDGD